MSSDPNGNGVRWVVGSAWPYIYAVPHLGNLIGSLLSADVFTRYLKLKGYDVVFVTGSDEHGTPIEVEAIKLGVEPRQLTDRMHEVIVRILKLWGIEPDNYTRTESDVHKWYVRDTFTKIYNNGYIFTKDDELPYCPKDKIFLPDRFVIGTCPYCGYPYARGDQCENCGKLLEPRMLINPKCAICGSTPEWRLTRHWYLDLRRLEDRIRSYIEGNNALPDNARQMSLGMLKEGLRPRAITRDNKWGIPAPFPGSEGKTIYVWFEAVLGYVSATIEYFRRLGREDEWRRFWFNKGTRVVFFIGKDNIPFHTIIFPALLMATGEDYVMPWTTSSTEYLIFEGRKFSKSQRVGIWADEAIALLPADYWRFYLIYNRPEQRDSNFTWDSFLDVVNSVMNDTVGNFIHRVLTLAKRRWGTVPSDVKMTEQDQEVYGKVLEILNTVEENYEKIMLKDAVSQSIEMARIGNRYLNEKQPWRLSGFEFDSALYMLMSIVKTLSVALAPVIPFSVSELWRMMGYSNGLRWRDAGKPIEQGLQLSEPKPLFRKISREELNVMLKKLDEIRDIKDKGKYPWEQAYLPTP
ncbi:methionine--tRNA ligase [Caldivirga sp.]|uniref:methionine--tRNA ligase n=1 Tax=Caldivirga sp. TaxID=2080243 RepID=UPI0025BDE0ED|nr:methionine--tRNA ligase [Caldivirga sp.]